MRNNLVRVGKFSIEEVFSKVILTEDNQKEKRKIPKVYFGDYKVNMTSQRYQLFLLKGIICAHCGIQGQFFSLDQVEHNGVFTYHFNLIAIDDEGNEILMTKDHILPKSKGGKDIMENYQTMCEPCNLLKRNNV